MAESSIAEPDRGGGDESWQHLLDESCRLESVNTDEMEEHGDDADYHAKNSREPRPRSVRDLGVMFSRRKEDVEDHSDRLNFREALFREAERDTGEKIRAALHQKHELVSWENRLKEETLRLDRLKFEVEQMKLNFSKQQGEMMKQMEQVATAKESIKVEREDLRQERRDFNTMQWNFLNNVELLQNALGTQEPPRGGGPQQPSSGVPRPPMPAQPGGEEVQLRLMREIDRLQQDLLCCHKELAKERQRREQETVCRRCRAGPPDDSGNTDESSSTCIKRGRRYDERRQLREARQELTRLREKLAALEGSRHRRPQRRATYHESSLRDENRPFSASHVDKDGGSPTALPVRPASQDSPTVHHYKFGPIRVDLHPSPPPVPAFPEEPLPAPAPIPPARMDRFSWPQWSPTERHVSKLRTRGHGPLFASLNDDSDEEVTPKRAQTMELKQRIRDVKKALAPIELPRRVIHSPATSENEG